MSEGGNRSQISAAVLEDEWEVYCESDSLSERGLRELFAQHGLRPGNQNRLSNYNFFDDIFRNERVTEGIIRLLLEYFPDAVNVTDEDGLSPFYYACLAACSNKNTTLSFIQLIVDADPDSVRSVNEDGCTPLHRLCYNINEQVDEPTALDILNLLIEMYPEAASHADNGGRLPIHLASGWRSGEFCQVLINATPDSVRSVDNYGCTPLHYLCLSIQVDGDEAMQVLILLIDRYPEAVRHANNEGRLPIHLACGRRSPEFFRVLVEAYPGSVSMPGTHGKLPLHYACLNGCSLATVEYLYQQYPDAINHAATGGFYQGHYPIHGAISRYDSATALKVVKFLLNCDPNQKLIQLQGKSLLRYACDEMTHIVSNIEAGIQLIKVLFDAHPEAIRKNGITFNIHRLDQQVQAFINGELVYSRQAKNLRLMMTPDDNGRLPLHTALQNNVRLGSIKLLVKGNPSALRTSDNNLAMPLHIACEHHDSAGVVQYLIERHALALEAVDRQGNTALHHACRGAKHDTISMLLENYDAVSVSKRNTQNKLPIDLLWESKEVSERESVEYTESVFRLLRANPEMINQ